jgi:hypothetical protein
MSERLFVQRKGDMTTSPNNTKKRFPNEKMINGLRKGDFPCCGTRLIQINTNLVPLYDDGI